MSGNNDRPRRSTRTPAKAAAAPETPASPTAKKGKGRAPEAQLEHLLTHSRSKLTTLEITDVINYKHFCALSPEAQTQLCALLPATAFQTYTHHVDATHPSGAAPPTANADVECSPAALDPAFFAGPFLRGAARAWQDHLYSGFFSATREDARARCMENLRRGDVRAEWKDEAWAREHPPRPRAGMHAAELDLRALASAGLVREGDVLAYSRRFPEAGLTVEKDMVVHKVDARTWELTVLLQPGSTAALPQDLLVLAPRAPAPPTLTIDGVLSAADLEEALLDVDGRVSYAQRHAAQALPRSAAAAKAVVVFRWRDEVLHDLELEMAMERGARERCGTVWYLRRS